jgi:prepilin-type N-terminal cleavage/methylation domain-containing protein
MKSQPFNKHVQGFSLIELLIASVVIASAAVLLIGGLIGANRAAALRTEAALMAQSLASQLALMGDQLSSNTPTSGPCASQLSDCAWTLAWSETALTPLAEATLRISRKDRTDHVVTYRALIEY